MKTYIYHNRDLRCRVEMTPRLRDQYALTLQKRVLWVFWQNVDSVTLCEGIYFEYDAKNYPWFFYYSNGDTIRLNLYHRAQKFIDDYLDCAERERKAQKDAKALFAQIEDMAKLNHNEL